MKNKNVSTSERSEKTLSVIKNVKVKLTPLSPDTIRRYLESSADRNCSRLELQVQIRAAKIKQF